MQYYEKKKNIYAKIFTSLVIIFPLTSIYATPIKSVSFGDLLILLILIPLTFDMFINTARRGVVPFWIYIMYAFGVTVVASFLFFGISDTYSSNDVINRIIRDGYFLVTIVVFGKRYFDFQYGKKLLKSFTIVLGGFIIVQTIAFMLMGIYIPGIIPGLNTTISGGISGMEYNRIFQHKAEAEGLLRSSGFLAEPAIVGQVVSVTLLLELFNDRKKINKALCLYFSLILVLSFSTNSYVALFVCWTLWTLYSNRHSRKNIIKILIGIIVLIIGLIIFVQNERTASVFARFFELRDRTSGSSVIRVLRGIVFYINMPLLFQLFGSGFGNFLEFKKLYEITTIYETADEYMNTNAYILISTGLIGFILFIITILWSIRNNDVVSKMIFILLLVFGLSSSIYSTPQFMIMMMFILFYPKERGFYEDTYYYTS